MKRFLNQNISSIVILGTIIVISTFLLFKFNFFNSTFLYTGTLEATKVDLSARLAAAIQEIKVHEGDKIKKGEILVILACEDYKITAKLVKANYDRNIKLLESGYISPTDMDQYKNQLDAAYTHLNWCTITSPLDGTVLSRNHEPGEWMNPGSVILTLANIKEIWAYIYVPQTVVAKLLIGMK